MGISTLASAHAIIVSAQPAPDSVVAGPDLAVVFAFNVRIDSGRSTLTLTRPDGTTSNIAQIPEANPAVLAGLTSGAYSIRWQVLATDGHITRGDVPFTVAP
jgi:methionine-rich copper-binding protein CopC